MEAVLTSLNHRIRAYRARCFAIRRITPLTFACRRDVPAGSGWAVSHGAAVIVVRSSRPQPGVVRFEVLTGIDDGQPVWAMFDEGPLQQV
jgi:hypothetical protein